MMSALGHKRTFGPRNAISALPPKADIAIFAAIRRASCSLAGIAGTNTALRLLNFSVTHRGDGLPANHYNEQFRADGKSKRAPVHRSVKQLSRCRYSPTSKPRRGDQHPSACKVRALQPLAQRARRPDHCMGDCTARAVRAGPRSVPGLLGGLL